MYDKLVLNRIRDSLALNDFSVIKPDNLVKALLEFRHKLLQENNYKLDLFLCIGEEIHKYLLHNPQYQLYTCMVDKKLVGIEFNCLGYPYQDIVFIMNEKPYQTKLFKVIL